MTENTPTTSRRDALFSLASATTVLLAGCNTVGSNTDNSDSPTNSTETNPPNGSVMTTTPRTVPNNGSESASNDTDTPSDTPSETTETPTSTPSDTSSSTETSTEDNDCALEFSQDVMQQARSVGLEARDAVVWLYHNEAGKGGENKLLKGLGTGWFIDDTHIVTNGHVVESYTDTSGSYRAITINGTSLELELIDYIYKDFPTRDVALLEVTTGSAPHTLSLGDTTALTDGQPIIQIGHPHAVGNWLIALGDYTGWGSGPNDDSLSAEIPSHSGNSGSPVLTLDGTVVGMTWGHSSPETEPGPPTPIDDDVTNATVYTEFPYQKRRKMMAEPIEDVIEHVNTWQN